MELEREDRRGANQLRPMDCSRNVPSRAHGSASCSHDATPFCMPSVLADFFLDLKLGQRRIENPEKACIEVIWKLKTGHIGRMPTMVLRGSKDVLQLILKIGLTEQQAFKPIPKGYETHKFPQLLGQPGMVMKGPSAMDVLECVVVE